MPLSKEYKEAQEALNKQANQMLDCASLIRLPSYEQYGPPVPGQGPVTQVQMIDGVVHAWRNNEDGVSICYRATDGGPVCRRR